MKIETIYELFKQIIKENGDVDVPKYLELRSKLEKEIRDASALKVTSKTRVSAIKRVASQIDARPILKGYAIQEINGETYRVVTDSYHLIAIKQDEMPLPLVATSDELEKLHIDKNEYMNKYGAESIICGVYPTIQNLIPRNLKDGEKIELDVDDVIAFDKMHKFDKTKKNEDLYKLRDGYMVNPRLLKNVLQVLGSDVEVYIQGDNRPTIITNKENEIGLVLPIRIY